MSAFHEGEIRLQTQAGVAERMATVGRVAIRDYMPDQHRAFFAQLPFLIVGSLDAALQPWASILANPPGFINSPEPTKLVIQAKPLSHDPLHRTLYDNARIALLGIEPHTRRRNRMNGWVDNVDEKQFSVKVQQSFGNCPKYIQPRQAQWQALPVWPLPSPVCTSQLTQRALSIIKNADTFFIASAHPMANAINGPSDKASLGVDVSHRGGKAGFVRVDDNNTLSVPDYQGNLFFNTLGNLALHSKTGLLFIDFVSHGLVYIAAEAEIVWDQTQLKEFEGAQRILRLKINHVIDVPNCLPIDWHF
jgi:uncharacterized protein